MILFPKTPFRQSYGPEAGLISTAFVLSPFWGTFRLSGYDVELGRHGMSWTRSLTGQLNR